MTPATVLVVEDEQIVGRGIRQALSALGYAVPEVVATAEQAIESAEELQPRLVLMDIKLAGKMDGVAAASEIRNRFDIPVVYLTSSSDEETHGRAAQTRPYGYLVKPFDTRALHTAVELALQKYDLERRLDAKQKWLSATIEAVEDAVIGTDPDGVVLFVNRVAEKLTGWTREEAAGKRIEDVFVLVDAMGVPIDDPVFAVLDRAHGRDSQEVAIESRIGDRVRVEPRASAIVDRRGGILGGVVAFRHDGSLPEIDPGPAQSEQRVTIAAKAPGIGHEINNALAYVISNIGFSLEGVREALLRLQGLELPKAARIHVIVSVISQLRDVTDALDDANEGADRVRRTVRDRPSEWKGLSSTEAAGTAAPIAAEDDAGREAGGRARMLVIDDDQAVAAAMARLLSLHHEVAIETDPSAALARVLRGEEFDVVFCDLTMPSTSGIDFYRSLAASRPRLAARVVFMTGGVFTEEAHAFLGQVSNASLTKPFSLESVERVVAQWVRVPPR